MMETAKAVKEKTKHIQFHLAGEGPERAKLQALIQQYGLNETFVPQGHLDDMLPFYRSLDFYLNTSVHEGIPMSPDYGVAAFAEDVRRRVRRRTLVLQKPDNKADSVKSATPRGFKCRKNISKISSTFWVKDLSTFERYNRPLLKIIFSFSVFEVHDLG